MKNISKKILQPVGLFLQTTYLRIPIAGVVKLVDTLDLGSSAARRGGSSPFTRTKQSVEGMTLFFRNNSSTLVFYKEVS